MTLPGISCQSGLTTRVALLVMAFLPGMIIGCGPSGEGLDSPAPSASPTPVGSPTPRPTPTPAATPTPTVAVPVADAWIAMVPDNGSSQFKFFAVESNRQLAAVDLRDVNPSVCGSGSCAIFGGHYHALDGQDYVDVTYSNPPTGGPAGTTTFSGYLERVKLGDQPRTRWRLHQLNFSGLPGGASAYCGASPQEPCLTDPSASSAQQALCTIGDAHDFRVFYDDPEAQETQLIVADTDNFRVLKVTLDYADGNTCGRVESVLDHTRSSDWPTYAQPNNMLRVPNEERELYMFTWRSVLSSGVNAQVEGHLALWEHFPDERWQRHWVWPDLERSGEFLMLPHGGGWLQDVHPDGDLILFAHSSSLNTDNLFDPRESTGGSIGVLLSQDALLPPDYLLDLYVPKSGAYWGFPRAMARLADGDWLVTDSGCIAPQSCSITPKLLRLDATALDNSSRTGQWTSSHEQLELTDQQPRIEQTFTCGLVSPYWSQVVPSQEVGEVLSAALARGGSACLP